MKKQPLLTKDQLIDWLIYHCPIHESGFNATPFRVVYHPVKSSITGLMCSTSYPPWAYNQLAIYIMSFPEVHQEITDLYWYWTIEPSERRKPKRIGVPMW
jgi:hypothetical protein